MENIIIVGGGVAGLSCLNTLLDHGITALLLEGATIGTPKMCGEFLAPAAARVLEQWNIGPIEPIYQAQFHHSATSLTIRFNQPAGALQRSDAEIKLAERATNNGARIRENATIQQITPGDEATPFVITLSSGEMLTAKTVFFATGKFTQAKTMSDYVGLKLHLPASRQRNTLNMYSVKGAYFGIVPVNREMSNMACLMRREAVDKIGSLEAYFHTVMAKHPALLGRFDHIDLQTCTHLKGMAPPFQQKINPAWPNAYWIGDAAASLHPAIGAGFWHSVMSAQLAVHCYLKENVALYKKQSHSMVRDKIIIGKILNEIMLRPTIGKMIYPFLKWQPWITNRLLRKLDY